MRANGGSVWAGILVVFLMVMSGCAAESPEVSIDQKNSTATTGPTVDLFATTTEPSTTNGPSTTVDEFNRSRSGNPNATAPLTAIPPEFGPSGLIWIGTWLGFSEDRRNVRFVLSPEGSVLRIDEGNIYSGAGSYLTWNIGPAGYLAVVDLIAELGLESDQLDPNLRGQSGEIRTNGSFNVRIDVLHAASRDLNADQQELRKNFRHLLSRLDDMAWLDGVTTVTQRAPWVPDRLSLNVRNEYNPIYYSTDAFAWPFEQSISEMAMNDSGDEVWICLEGADAETAWHALMIDGVNNARLPIEEDGQLMEAGVRVSHAMYQGISPCQGATGFGTGSSPDRADRADLSELFLTEADLGDGWVVGIPSVTPPPPNIANCSPMTEAEIAIDEFDSWISHTVDIDLPGSISQFEMLGEIPDGVDAVAVIEQVGTMSCLAGLGQFGVLEIEGGMVENPPAGVTAAAYWVLTYDGVHQVVIDSVLTNGLAMVIGATSGNSLELSDLEPNYSLAVAKALAG